MPAFYTHPQSLGDVIDHVVARVLDQVGVETDLSPRWKGALLRRVEGQTSASDNSGDLTVRQRDET